MASNDIPMSLKYPIDLGNPNMVHGRDLAREALSAAFYDAEEGGYAANLREVAARVLLQRDTDTLLGFVGELFAWTQIAVQVATMLQPPKTIETVVGDIIQALNGADRRDD